MNKDNLNRSKVFFAQGEREINNARNKLDDNNDGKVRTLARRAAGFYIDGFLELNPKSNYGHSFINHLKAIQNDDDIPINIREAANKLTSKVGVEDLSGTDSIQYAQIIIDYCKINSKFD